MIYCFLADGFEEIEALATVDILRRAGVEVSTVSVTDNIVVTGSHNIPVVADTKLCCIDDVKADITGAIYPGGMPGSETLSTGSNTLPVEVARYCVENNILIGAICAAPIVLGRINLLDSKKVTCYPGFENELIGADYTGKRVEVDKNIVTGRGPGCSVDFALTLVSIIKGESVSNDIRKSMQCDE